MTTAEMDRAMLAFFETVKRNLEAIRQMQEDEARAAAMHNVTVGPWPGSGPG